MTLREDALAELAEVRTETTTAENAAKAALVERARAEMVPVLTDNDGVAVFDPATMTVRVANLERALVVLSAGDGSQLHFAVDLSVTPAVVYLVKQVDGQWTQMAAVKSLAAVGLAVEKGLV